MRIKHNVYKKLVERKRNSNGIKAILDQRLGYDGITLVGEQLEKSKHSNRVINYSSGDINIMKKENLLSVGTESKNIEKKRIYYYISDIHLDYKINVLKLDGKGAESYIRQAARDIRQSYCELREKFGGGYILFNGDLSSDYEQLDIFFDEYTKPLMKGDLFSYDLRIADNTIFVAGNHELWSESSTPDEMIMRLDNLLTKKYHIHFLQNNLFLVGENGIVKTRLLSQQEIEEMSVLEIRQLASTYSEIILGGIGFSGYNDYYNAFNSGIYRGTVKSREEDIKLTHNFEKIYNKLNDALGDVPVICFTHMQKEDWSKEKYNSNWIYVCGHTHQNRFMNDYDKKIMADNQIGYKNESYELKYFVKDYSFNPLSFFEDGIHDITQEQYCWFMYFMNIHISMKKKDRVIRMLKRNNIYMFFAYISEWHEFYLLDGGKTIKMQYWFDYYYENMELYQEAIAVKFQPMQDALKNLSDKIKAIGGDGHIHGCIVDINYYNHVYINPFDGKVTAYYATSKGDKWVYTSVAKLLENRLPQMYIKYLSLQEEQESNITKNDNSIDTGVFVSDTDQYKVSEIARKHQYALEQHVIRTWDDNILRKYKEECERTVPLIDQNGR